MFTLTGNVAHSQDVPAIQKGPTPFPTGPFPNLSQTPRAVRHRRFLALGPVVDVTVPIRTLRATITSTCPPRLETGFCSTK